MFNISEEDKKKALNKMFWTFGIIFFVMTFLYFSLDLGKNPKELSYTFFLEGEELESIMVCEEKWHYEGLDFIPCLINNTFGGLFSQTINWSLSPQENCHFWDGEFTGFNIYNETRAKEIYDSVLPKCFELKDEEISYVWLDASECFCLDESLEFNENCEEYNCGGGLIVKRK